jgi:hypothetical protein
VWIALPQFSRRIALSTGFGARFLELRDVTRSGSGTMSSLTAEYAYKPSLTFDAGLQFVF